MPSLRKLYFSALGILVIAWAYHAGEPLLQTGIAHAQGLANTRSTLATVVTILTLAASVLNYITYPVLYIVGLLLDPEFVMNLSFSESGGEEVLLLLWRTSRDIMNVIFAFLLIIGATMTVILARGDIIRQYIIKFVLAVILVNFSWFFPRVVLDVANILTATIYQVASNTSSQNCTYRDIDGEDKPCRKVDGLQFFKNPCDGEFTDIFGGGILCVKFTALEDDVSSPMGIINGLVINHGRLPFLVRLTNFNVAAGGAGLPAQMSEIIALIMRAAMTLFLEVAMVFPLIAMMIAFFIRIPILWGTIAFMPFMFLGFIVGDKMGSNNTMDLIWGKFLRSAFLPVVIAIPLALGFMMINALMTIEVPPGFEALEADSSSFVPTVSNLWEFVWLCLSFCILWAGTFAAMKIDDVYASVGGSVQSIGKAYASAPLSVPFIPVPGSDGKQFRSVNDYTRMAKNPSYAFDKWRYRDDKSKPGKPPGPTAPPEQIRDAAKTIKTDIKLTADIRNNFNTLNTSTDPAAINQALGEIKRELQARGLEANEGNARQLLQELGHAIGPGSLADQNLRQFNTALPAAPPAKPGP